MGVGTTFFQSEILDASDREKILSREECGTLTLPPFFCPPLIEFFGNSVNVKSARALGTHRAADLYFEIQDANASRYGGAAIRRPIQPFSAIIPLAPVLDVAPVTFRREKLPALLPAPTGV